MKRTVTLLFGASMLLAGCGAQNIVYDIAFRTVDKAQQGQLLLASIRVIERRLNSIGKNQLLDHTIDTKNGAVSITLSIRDKAAAEILANELMQSFTLNIMLNTDEGEESDVTIDGHGGFKKTDITEEHLLWAEAQEDTRTGESKGRIFLIFTQEGQQKMQKLFQGNLGSSIGLFVRGRLVSKLRIDVEIIEDNIVIDNIPSY